MVHELQHVSTYTYTNVHTNLPSQYITDYGNACVFEAAVGLFLNGEWKQL